MGNNLIIHFLKNYKKILIFYILAVFLQGFVMYLGNISWEIISYIVILISFIGIVTSILEYIKYSKKIKELQNGIIPQRYTQLESEYINIINKLKIENNNIIANNREKQKEMVDFYTMWVHQIKTPIAALDLLLQDKEFQSVESQNLQVHKELENELFKIEQYVEMVLSFLRSGSDYSDYVIGKYNLEEIVKQAVRKYAKQFIRKKISIELTNLNKEIVTDEKWLVFVIEQLLSNALKYSQKGKVSIYIDTKEELVIQDTGIGISKEDIPRIFQMGYTGYNGRMDKKSTGIGLYLCKSILARIGGSIRAESEINKGTKIVLNLKNEKLDI